MSEDQYKKTTTFIAEASHRLESILPEGNEMARRDLINLRQMARLNLVINYQNKQRQLKK